MTAVRLVLAGAPGAPDVEPRVAASLTHLGLVARLLSPVLGAALVAGAVPVAAPEGVRVHLVGANPLPLSMQAVGTVPVPDPVALAAALARHWWEPAVRPLTERVARQWRLSAQVLRGNTASAVAGALAMAVRSAPASAGPAAAALDALLSDGPLAGAGVRGGTGFVRRSCCLLYRLPGAGTCADCILPGAGAARSAAPRRV